MNASEAALIAAHQIEDIFCQHHAGGRVQRVARIQVAICDAIARARADDVAATDPQPASSAAVQDEAAVIQGEDQRAQKGPERESPPPAQASAGAAEKADVSCADPRNSSRPAGEVASAPFPVDRTEARPVAQIVKPKVKSKPLNPRPGKIAGVEITHRGSVISVDIINGVVECEGHPDWQTSLPVAAFLAHMRDGDLYNAAALAKVADMPLAAFTGGVWRWQAELHKRGVEFEITALGCRLRRAAA